MAGHYKEISVRDLEGFLIGQAENKEAGTGCTVIACKDGMRAGLDVRGGGPASRDSQMLNPLMTMQEIHAVVLSGGSAPWRPAFLEEMLAALIPLNGRVLLGHFQTFLRPRAV